MFTIITLDGASVLCQLTFRFVQINYFHSTYNYKIEIAKFKSSISHASVLQESFN